MKINVTKSIQQCIKFFLKSNNPRHVYINNNGLKNETISIKYGVLFSIKLFLFSVCVLLPFDDIYTSFCQHVELETWILS